MTREPRRKKERALSTCRSGFTLIEMLVVIVIIVILMGVVFKLSKGAMDKATYANESKRLSILRTLIEEFHAEYNAYPPVPVYVVGSKKFQPFNFTGAFPPKGDARDLDYYPTHYSAVEGKYFVFGLMSVFVRRDYFCQRAYDVAGKNHTTVNDQWENEGNNDMVDGNAKIKITKKDKAFAKRVLPILSQIYDCYSTNDRDAPEADPPSYPSYYNRWVEIDPDTGRSRGFTTNIKDSWGHDYVYVSKPPYTTYLIFSPGPDGVYDDKNPGDRSSEKNKDNVYGNLGDK